MFFCMYFLIKISDRNEEGTLLIIFQFSYKLFIDIDRLLPDI